MSVGSVDSGATASNHRPDERVKSGKVPPVVSSSIWPHIRLLFPGLLINVCGQFLPLYSSLIYNRVVSSGNFSTLWALTIGVLLFVALETVLRIARSLSMERLTARLARERESRLLARLSVAESSGLPPTGNFISRYRDVAVADEHFAAQYISNFVDIPFIILFAVAIFVVGGPIAYVPLACGAVSIAGQYLFTVAIRRLEQGNALFSAERLRILAEFLSGFDTLKASPLYSSIERSWAGAVGQATKAAVNVRIMRAMSQLWTNVWVSVSSIMILVVGVYMIEDRLLNVGALVGCSLLAMRVMGLLAAVTSLAVASIHMRDAHREFTNVMPAERPGPEVLGEVPPGRGEFIIRKLSFGTKTQPNLFKDLTVALEPGKCTAIVGATGSGKTTLLKLLTGLQAPVSGEVLLDGVQMSALSQRDRWRLIAYKRQEPAIFTGTLLANLGAENVAPERLHGVCSSLGLGTHAADGTFSLDMPLLAGGQNLSQGQRQLIDLARVLLRDCPVLVLDEPTAGLDPETEDRAVAALSRYARGRTMVIATHSPRLLKIADRMLMLGKRPAPVEPAKAA